MSSTRQLKTIPNAPPLHPRSTSDVASFQILEQSLRQHPELAKEGDKILNPYMLAKLVDGMLRFMDDHLGPKSKTKYWPLLHPPTALFHDRSRSGPLYTIILSAFRTKAISPWRNFNFDNPKLFDDNISLLKRVEGDLRNAGFLEGKRIYFDESVRRGSVDGMVENLYNKNGDRGRKNKNDKSTIGEGEDGKGGYQGMGANEYLRLEKIVERFGGVVVRDVREVARGGVTHIVGWDPEEHDAKEVIDEEDRREKAGEEVEKTYLRTLGVAEFMLSPNELEQVADDGDGDGGGVSSSGVSTPSTPNRPNTPNANSNTDDTKVLTKMALVHWWYHPSSFDEWMPLTDVSGDTEEEPPPSGPPGGPKVVGCKFVRDVEKFNEWGVESDYAILEYDQKLGYFQTEPTATATTTAAATAKPSSSTSSKKSKKRKNEDISTAEDDNDAGFAGAADAANDKSFETPVATPASSPLKESKKDRKVKDENDDDDDDEPLMKKKKKRDSDRGRDRKDKGDRSERGEKGDKASKEKRSRKETDTAAGNLEGKEEREGKSDNPKSKQDQDANRDQVNGDEDKIKRDEDVTMKESPIKPSPSSKSDNLPLVRSSSTASILGSSSPEKKKKSAHHFHVQKRPISDRRKINFGGSGGGGSGSNCIKGGLNPRRIHTGILGSRGESIRRTVHDGALRVSHDAYWVVRNALMNYSLGSSIGASSNIIGADKVGTGGSGKSGRRDSTTITPILLSAKPELRKFLPATAMIRPSIDNSSGRKKMTVTELTLSGEKDLNGEYVTVAVNKEVDILVAEDAKDSDNTDKNGDVKATGNVNETKSAETLEVKVGEEDADKQL